jgi:hypothetical protein
MVIAQWTDVGRPAERACSLIPIYNVSVVDEAYRLVSAPTIIIKLPGL